MVGKNHILEIFDKVRYEGHAWHVEPSGHGFLVQIRYNERDVDTGELKEQHGRKWYVSPHATESEIVQTMLLAAKQSAEHRVREHFLYLGRRIFSPHFKVGALVDMIDDGNFERRLKPQNKERD